MLVTIQRYPSRLTQLDTLFELGNGFDTMLDTMLWSAPSRRQLVPALDVAENDNEYAVVAELPGVSKEDISLTVEAGVLTLSGKRAQRTVPENGTWLRNETPSGEFSRSIRLGNDVDVSRISAELTNGVLTVVLPKVEQAKPREITIR